MSKKDTIAELARTEAAFLNMMLPILFGALPVAIGYVFLLDHSASFLRSTVGPIFGAILFFALLIVSILPATALAMVAMGTIRRALPWHDPLVD